MSRTRTVVLVQRPPRERAAFFEGRILTLDDRIAWLADELRRSMRERRAMDRQLAKARSGVSREGSTVKGSGTLSANSRRGRAAGARKGKR